MNNRLKHLAFKNFMGIKANGKPGLYNMDGVNTHVQENLASFIKQRQEKPGLRVVSFQQGFQLFTTFMIDAVHDNTFDEVFCKKYRGDINIVLEHEFDCRIEVNPKEELELRAFPPKRDLW